jgi:hypothetical protein
MSECDHIVSVSYDTRDTTLVRESDLLSFRDYDFNFCPECGKQLLQDGKYYE